ncbi:hypothetical protein P7C73_g513, partial [Tremellales sp. Uapishka_1]
MSLVNVTIDDFDPLVVYSNYNDWITPNPQDNPTWFNSTRDVTQSPWHEGGRWNLIAADHIATYHSTTVVGATASLNFTGSSLSIYGNVGPNGSNYTINIDPSTSKSYTYTATLQNSTERILLYHSDELTYSPHTVEMVNTGTGLLIDLIVVGVELGASGATLTNSTLDDSSTDITYSGTWASNSEDGFYGGTSHYTDGAGDSMSFQFQGKVFSSTSTPRRQCPFSGSAVYIYGDQVNDHGYFSVYLNESSTAAATLTGRSGCNGTYAKYCEKLGGLHFFAGNLPEGTHSVKLVNVGGSASQPTYFDLDYVRYTTPSAYSSQSLTSNSSCPFTTCSAANTSSATTTSISASSTGSAASSASSTTAKASGGSQSSLEVGTGALALMIGSWFAKQWLR